MIYDRKAVAAVWPARFPMPEITEHDNGIHVRAAPPEGAETPWHVEIRANSESGHAMLDAHHFHEDGCERIKLNISPSPAGDRMRDIVGMVSILWESTVNELHG